MVIVPVHLNVSILFMADIQGNDAHFKKETENFWFDPRSRRSKNWNDHQEINRVMLATSLSPDGFLGV